MKKITIQITNTGLILENTPTWYMHWLTSMEKSDALKVNAAINSLVEQGDIWFINDEITNNGSGFTLRFIFDSKEAVDKWNEVRNIFEKMYDLAGETPSILEEDMAFEEFADFASANSETEFTGLPEDF